MPRQPDHVCLLGVMVQQRPDGLRTVVAGVVDDQYQAMLRVGLQQLPQELGELPGDAPVGHRALRVRRQRRLLSRNNLLHAGEVGRKEQAILRSLHPPAVHQDQQLLRGRIDGPAPGHHRPGGRDVTVAVD